MLWPILGTYIVMNHDENFALVVPSACGAKSIRARLRRLSLNSGIETADSADFTDFEGVIRGDERTNLFVAKLQGIDIRNLLYPCNLRNLRLNPFRFLG
jgi:hypothetical protein